MSSPYRQPSPLLRREQTFTVAQNGDGALIVALHVERVSQHTACESGRHGITLGRTKRQRAMASIDALGCQSQPFGFWRGVGEIQQRARDVVPRLGFEIIGAGSAVAAGGFAVMCHGPAGSSRAV
jgi:hypothetical protein